MMEYNIKDYTIVDYSFMALTFCNIACFANSQVFLLVSSIYSLNFEFFFEIHMHDIVGVYLQRNGVFLANNSAVFISDIGDASNNRLQCITDRMPCCAKPNRVGEWYFPGNGGMVPPIGSSPTTFYRNRGENGTVNLNRVSNDVMMPTGQYCCVVSDATNINRMACAIICELRIIIMLIDITSIATVHYNYSHCPSQ